MDKAFTLIELSIVLVIIGLIVGGVLVGRDLIRAAEIRAQVTQIEKINTAVNTFRGKFNHLPGDIPAALVTQFGFTAAATRAGTVALGNGNGLVEGWLCSDNAVNNLVTCGETAWFWTDLSSNSRLIEGDFNTAGSNPPTIGAGVSSNRLIPPAKIGKNYLYIYASSNLNYYGLSASNVDNNGALYGNPGLTVIQAYTIDTKLDDGIPQSGIVTARYANCCPTGNTAVQWADPSGTITGAAYTTALAASSTTCYDNNNVAGAAQRYSITQNNGGGVNCALSFLVK